MIRSTVAAVLAVAVLVTGCGDDGSAAPTTQLRVFAASSLTEAFTGMEDDFEAEHPGVDVSFTFGASSALAQQIADGAPADVFVPADERTMAGVVGSGAATTSRIVARNRLALVVEAGNPLGITGLADLGRPGVVFILCAPEVPCGRFGAAALVKAGVTASPASLEENVKGVVSKVTLGEADAGIVYETDVRAAGDGAEGVVIEEADDPTLQAAYPAAVLTAAGDEKAAEAWIDHLLSERGRAAFDGFGFLAP